MPTWSQGSVRAAKGERIIRRISCQENPSLPGFHLLSHRLEVPLHSIHADRDAVDERKRLRVFREHGSEHAWDNASELTWSAEPILPTQTPRQASPPRSRESGLWHG